jgi:hypothetical protein
MKHPCKKLIYKIIPVLLTFTFCTKQVPGPQGDPGDPGKMGNAKQSSRVISLYAAGWDFNGGYYTNDINLPEITDAVISKGDVKVYIRVGNAWWSLPYAVGDIITQMSIEKGILHLKYYKIHGGPPPAPGALNFRIVTVVPV